MADEVAETLKQRAVAAGMSLSAYVARAANAEIVQRLKARDRSTGPSTAEIVQAARAGRR